MFGALIVGGLIYPDFTKSKVWAISFLLGNWAHDISDIGDTMGTMLLFPFSDPPVSLSTPGRTPARLDAMSTQARTSQGWGSSGTASSSCGRSSAGA